MAKKLDPRENHKKRKLRVGKSVAGLGLFADEDIKRGEFVIEYTGEKITPEEADRREGRYLFDVDKDLVLDGKDRKHTSRYMNHSCKPNCFAERDMDQRRVFIYAKKNIAKGEELFYNYGIGYWEDVIGGKKGCRCPACKPPKNKK